MTIRFLRSLAVLGFMCAGATSTWMMEGLRQTPSKVGMVTREFVDNSRKNWSKTGPRPIRTAIWYPASADAGVVETIFGGPPEKEIFSPVTVISGAEVLGAGQKRPLILLSHGTGGSAIQTMWLGYYLAERGYIVAAVNHHGNTSGEPQPTAQGFLLYWERAKDLSAVLDNLIADPLVGPSIDRDRIGAAGFSLGGYTVLLLAGGRFSTDQFESFCNSTQRDFTCEAQPEFPSAPKLFEQLKGTDLVVRESLRHAGDSYRDKRIQGVFAIAPVLGGGFKLNSLRNIRVPVRIVVGQGDTVAPLSTNAQLFANLIQGARLTILPGGVGHYTFLAECSPRGKIVVEICRDDQTIDRKHVHQTTAKLAFDFFEESLKKQRKKS